MSLKDLDIHTSYETLKEDPVEGFYVPALEEAVTYDRIAGFFSSTSLALAARGIAGLIDNGGHMRLIVSPRLSDADIEAIKAAGDSPQQVIESLMIENFEELGKTLQDKHVQALSWMLAKGYLELRIACVTNDGKIDPNALFHQKVGLISDKNGNEISFSGSINETASGWLLNSEEFKVFKSWEPGQEPFYESDREKFESFWNGEREHTRVFEPSDAFVYEVVKLCGSDEPDRKILRSYAREKKMQKAHDDIPLFFYQADAIKAWEENDKRLRFEMATGTGKTRTAIACANIAKAGADDGFVCIVAAPEITLARQWDGEFKNLGVEFDSVIFADSSSGGKAVWAPDIKKQLSRIAIGFQKSILVMTTHATASVDAFTDLFRDLDEVIKICFIGDETHGLGSRMQRKALLDRYDYRVGLSATPSRWFDEDGTAVLTSYFGEKSFVFGIRDAQNTINPLTGFPFLTPYVYKPVFVSLDDEEMGKYIALTEKIVKMHFSKDEEKNEAITKLLNRRAEITKNAAEKMSCFDGLISSEKIDKTLVFASPQQIDEVCRKLAAKRIAAHPFTMKQGTKKKKEFGGLSEREYLLQQFREGNYQALVAISCLDEGIDIPVAEQAILLSSSTNPREYIQRVGRVIRVYPGKKNATIIDVIVEPDWGRICDPEILRYEIKVFEKELHRVSEMAENAINSVDIMLSIDERWEKLYGLQ